MFIVLLQKCNFSHDLKTIFNAILSKLNDKMYSRREKARENLAAIASCLSVDKIEELVHDVINVFKEDTTPCLVSSAVEKLLQNIWLDSNQAVLLLN